jgi:hypothetical protein
VDLASYFLVAVVDQSNGIEITILCRIDLVKQTAGGGARTYDKKLLCFGYSLAGNIFGNCGSKIFLENSAILW